MSQDTNPLTMARMKKGQRARIERVDSSDPSVVRLMILGLVEGTEVEFRQSALGGDPLEFRVFGSTLSLRRAQADRFEVTPVDSRA